MFRNKIRLDTGKDIRKFMEIVTKIDAKISVEDDEGNRVSAKSALGLRYASREFENKYCISDIDISGKIIDFII